MAYDKHDTERLLALVEKHVKSSPEYSQEDWDALHSMARAWLGIVAFGRLGKWLITPSVYSQQQQRVSRHWFIF